MTDWLMFSYNIHYHILYNIPNASLGFLHLNFILTPSSDGQFLNVNIFSSIWKTHFVKSGKSLCKRKVILYMLKWAQSIWIKICSLIWVTSKMPSCTHLHACWDPPPSHDVAINTTGLEHCFPFFFMAPLTNPVEHTNRVRGLWQDTLQLKTSHIE